MDASRELRNHVRASTHSIGVVVIVMAVALALEGLKL